ncbi:MAG: PfaD family polyunsaturated fatty acid/polyketide biosynthesis protein [Deltaproteobacteria bacterium]|nr:PfaD family polyunsaturated fatty acid/polyketide biosynthesis protein [Deltaproteobacteria bacterium]MBT4525495.1 PfaD family polyunsaturated fatty acid/polyketide biosynthesis protein [Deltaproteobacteria bacterium]
MKQYIKNLNDYPKGTPQKWQGESSRIAYDLEGMKHCLENFQSPCFVIDDQTKTGLSNDGYLGASSGKGTKPYQPIPCCFPFLPSDLGDPAFKTSYGLRYPYFGGSMANGISSAEMVIALGKAGCMASFGSGGLIPANIEKAIRQIQSALPTEPYAFNLIHSPFEPELEKKAVELYLKYNVNVIEASAYIDLTAAVVYYRIAGLSRGSNGIEVRNKIIAKISRKEVAEKFMSPPSDKILNQLISEGLISQEQATLAQNIPVADDITVEADSGGHTDNRPLVSLLPSIISLRDQLQTKFQYLTPIRVGAAGGISTPESALAAFAMGAAYIMTGSINQGCLEAGTSDRVKKLLTQVDIADVTMAPASDMFEMGVKLQTLKKGTLFPMRGTKLYEIYQKYQSIDEIPPTEKLKLEKQLFQKSLDEVWQETVSFFSQRDPTQINKAAQNPKKKMALIFRWYLGLSSFWAKSGVSGREMDYQIWCGPAMGAFNEWVKGSYLEQAENRSAADVALQILRGAAYLTRVNLLKAQSIWVSPELSRYDLKK